MHAELERGRELEVIFLQPLAEQRTFDAVGEDFAPVDLEQFGLDLRRAHAAGVQATDDRAHRGAGDHVNGDALALEDLEHTHVSDAARAATREHQADARSCVRR